MAPELCCRLESHWTLCEPLGGAERCREHSGPQYLCLAAEHSRAL